MPEDREAWRTIDRVWTRVLIEPLWQALTRSGRRRRNAERSRRECLLRRRNCAGRL